MGTTYLIHLPRKYIRTVAGHELKAVSVTAQPLGGILEAKPLRQGRKTTMTVSELLLPI
jgi:hypothetical protein